MKFDYVSKPVFCERNLPACGSHIHSSDKTWEKVTYDLLYKNPYSFVTTWSNQMESSLTCRKEVIVILITPDFKIQKS